MAARYIEAWFDGCCEPRNPGGHAAWGAVVHVDGTSVYRGGGYCGVGPQMSNNVAEYSGFCAALTESIRHANAGDRIHIRGDSRLVICQLFAEAARRLGYSKTWKVNGGFYMPFYREAKAALSAAARLRITAEWIPREQNDLCDVLSKEQLHDRGVVFRIQPEPVQKALVQR